MESPMDEAIRLARSAAGDTFPNPLVGSVLVRDDVVLGSGAHLRAGGFHAEVNAIKSSGDVRGATLYVTLEPCAHEGRQPPCVLEIIRSGLKKVVIGTLDPNPVTAGRGVLSLRNAGIEVVVLNDPASVALVRDFKVWINSALPYVALKMASSVDGFVATKVGERLPLTGNAWRSNIQRLRFEHQAVMVGAGTVLVDNPRLVVDRASRAVAFRRVVVAGRRSMNPAANVFLSEKGYLRTIVLVPESGESAEWVGRLREVADVLPCPDRDGVVNLPKGLRLLRDAYGIVSIISEGGPMFAKNLLDEDLVETIYWAYAPRLLASPGAVAAISPEFGDISRLRFQLVKVENLGGDLSAEFWRDRNDRV